jgi:transcriptional regulator with XRE-family HTH domain
MPARQGPISNFDLGRLLGVTHSQVSRMRKGARHPSIETMDKLEQLLGWDFAEQAQLVRRDRGEDGTPQGAYAEAFEAVLMQYEPEPRSHGTEPNSRLRKKTKTEPDEVKDPGAIVSVEFVSPD